MASTKANRRTGDAAAAQATCYPNKNDCENSHQPIVKQATIRAELFGSQTCTAASVTATGHAPVLALCRSLIAAGLDPDTAVDVYRGAVLALCVRSIREGATLTVSEEANRPPRFKRWKPRDVGEGSPAGHQNEKSDLAAIEPAE
jgi:hypothetical protein